MKKLFGLSLILLLCTGFFFSNYSRVQAADQLVQPSITATEDATKSTNECGWLNLTCGLFNKLLTLPGVISIGVLKIASLLTYLAGGLLNWVVQYTVVHMKEDIGNSNITNAWKVIRDVGNMGFIFVLLYAAIKTIIGQGENNQRLIVNIVIAAVLMNFSLFFTKIVIDASNVLAMTFYDKIAPGALNSDAWANFGITNSLMKPLGIQTIWDATKWDGKNLLIIGIMGTVFCLVAAFIFVAVSLLFIARFVILIILMALSPIMFLAMVLPGAKKYYTQWWDALIGQAFFAPVYFIMTWVILALMQGLLKKQPGSLLSAVQKTGQLDAIGLVVNFLIVIGFLIASIIVAKKMSDQTPYGFNKITGWALGAAGGATFGTVGRIGRNTVGRAAAQFEDSKYGERLKESAAKGNVAARFALQKNRAIGSSSFDYRAGTIGGVITGKMDAGKAGGKGGYVQYRNDKNKEEENFAKSLGPSDLAKANAKKALENAEKQYGKDSEQATQARDLVEKLEGVSKEKLKERANEAIKNDDVINNVNRIKEEVEKREKYVKNEIVNDPAIKKVKQLERELQDAEIELGKTKIHELIEAQKKVVAAKKEEIVAAKRAAEDRQQEIENEIVTQKKTLDAEAKKASERREEINAQHSKPIEGAGDARRKAYADRVESSAWAKFRGYNYTAAAQIRRGKSSKDRAAEVLKDLAKDSGVEVEEEPPAAAAPAPAPTAPTPPAGTP